jgi:hypothetical protein
MLPPKHLSGAQKRKKKKQEDLFIESQKGAIHKFFRTAVVVDVNPGLDNIRAKELEQQLMELDNANEQENENLDSTNDETEDATEHENLQHSSHTKSPDVNDEQEDLLPSIYDPRMWDSLDNIARDILVKKGHVREYNLVFPTDRNNRHFPYAYYSRKLNNSELVDQKWLVYSKHVGKVYYFCRKLFKSNQSKCLLASDGLNDWKHLRGRLKTHENSVEHITNMKTLH